MKIKIIRKGNRESLRIFRNYIAIVLGIGFIAFAVLLWFNVSDQIALYSALGLCCLSIVAIIISIRLRIHKTIGVLYISDTVLELQLDNLQYSGSLVLMLNADAADLRRSRKNSMDVRGILSYGNFLTSENNPDAFGDVELLITNAQKRALIVLENSNLRIAERFSSRPFIQEPPIQIIYSIASIFYC